MKQKLVVPVSVILIFAFFLPVSGIAANQKALTQIEYVYLPLMMWQSSPDQPSSPSPEDGSFNVDQNVELSWVSSDKDGDSVTFDVYFEANNPAPDVLVSSNQSSLIYNPGELALSTIYYWQIIARDENGNISTGPVWFFITSAPDEMIHIPEGNFRMGCDPATDPRTCKDDETPLHTVYLDSYFIDKYEVTNNQYRNCVAVGECTLPSDRLRFNDQNYGDHPVIFVTLYQAEDYCAWNGKRLLTEAEWEKAARGSTDTRPYPWGTDEIGCKYGNFYMESTNSFCVGDTTPVGTYPKGASPYDVFDMIGNAWEWVNDRYHETYYEWSPDRNPQGPPPQDPDLRLARGGCWRSYDYTNRVTDRTAHYLADKLGQDKGFFGIRCGMSIPGQ